VVESNDELAIRRDCYRKFFEQLRGERQIPVSDTLTLPDVNHHALAVDVLDLDPCRLGSPHPRRIEQHQDHAVQAVGCGVDPPSCSGEQWKC